MGNVCQVLLCNIISYDLRMCYRVCQVIVSSQKAVGQQSRRLLSTNPAYHKYTDWHNHHIDMEVTPEIRIP